MHYEQVIDSVTLRPSQDGRFEVTVGDQVVFSKAALHRHAREGEIVALIGPLAEAAEAAIRTGF
jgi:hypothetical protein